MLKSRRVLFFRLTLILFGIISNSMIIFSQNDYRKVAIIGGGIAGVSSAYYISQFDNKVEITVFEKEPKIGGNAITVEVKNTSDELVKVDIGPQYFTEGPWDDYIQFLNEALGKNAIESELITGTLLVQQENEPILKLITPLDGDFRGEKISKLLKIKKFNAEAFKVYQNPEKWKGISIELWVESLKFEEKFKNEIIYPFLAASLGTTVNKIKTCSAIDIVKLFAFRRPKASNSFQIMTTGMGELVERIGLKLEEKGVHFALNSPVISVKRVGNMYEVISEYHGDKTAEMFDFVVFAVHADQLLRILDDADDQFQDIKNALKGMEYFDAHIVLHQDSNFVNIEKPAFLNIVTNEQNELLYSTMNLSLISPRLQGIYKSWLTQEQTAKIKLNGYFLEETTFYHPLINIQFIAQLEILNKIIENYPSISVIGGWSQGLETQNSAVISGQKSMKKYEAFLESSSNY